MIQLSPQTRIFVAIEPVDFRSGIDSLGGICRRHLDVNPLDGAIYVFRNRARTSLRLLCHDGQGQWLCTKRLSATKLRWWPTGESAHCQLSWRELYVLLNNGNPQQAQMSEDWRRVA